MTSQEQLLIGQIVPADISRWVWDIKLEGGTWICRGKINYNLWFLDAITTNSITRVLHIMRRNCKNLLNTFILEQRQPILFTVGIIYQIESSNGVDSHFKSCCTSDKIQPEVTLYQKNSNLPPMTNFNRDYGYAVMNLIQKFFQLEGSINREITSFCIEYKTLRDECSYHLITPTPTYTINSNNQQ